MSILIKGMAMPKSCVECPCYNDEIDICNITSQPIVIEDWHKRRVDCPLDELPHGDLIDRDSVLEILSDKNAAWDGYVKVKALPIVVESEDG